MTSRTRASIILPVFNGSQFLERTILSVLAQDYKDFQLIICDDASTDDSLNIIEKYLSNDSRISLLKNPKNLGIGATFKRLLREVNGEYIAQIGHDDLWLPTFLSSTVQALTLDPNLSVSFSNVQIIDAKDAPLKTPKIFDYSLLANTRESLAGELLKGNFLCASSSLIRNSFFRDLYKKLPELNHLQDYWLWQQLILKGPFHFIDKPLVQYRIHKNNFSFHNAHRRTEQLELNQCRVDMLNSPHWPQILKNHSSEQIYSLFSPLLSTALVPMEIAPLLPPLITSIYQSSDRTEVADIYNFLRWSCGAASAKITSSVEKIVSTNADSFDSICSSWVILIGKFSSPPRVPFLKITHLGPIHILRFKSKKGLLPWFSIARNPSKSLSSFLEGLAIAKGKGTLKMLKYILKNLVARF